jgi:CRISPR-associated endonuclease/helicase Cas3
VPAPRKRDRQQFAADDAPRQEECWAKTTSEGQPGVSVRDHCLNVGCVAEALLALLPSHLRGVLPPGVATLAALHDVGKVSPGFQQKCDAWVRDQPWFKRDAGYESRHQRVSQVFLESLHNGCLREWAEAVGAHHGRVQGDDPRGGLGGQAWEQARRNLLHGLEKEFGRLPESDAPNEATKWLLAGLIAVADWLGSDEKDFSPQNLGPLDKAAQGKKAAAIVTRLELGGGEFVPGKIFEQVFAGQLEGNPPRPLQQAIIAAPSLEPGVYVIEDTMGSGKTEAALWLAYRLITTGQARGMYFGLPTRITSDRIHRRVREFLAGVKQGSVDPPLVHGHAWLREIPVVGPSWRDSRDDGDARAAAEATKRWFASTRCGLLAPFAVGTADQSLLGVVAAKWFFVRQFALAGKVVVLDEVHSYDLYTGTLISHLVQRLRELHATPVILSATLTGKQRADLLGQSSLARRKNVPYPALTIKVGRGRGRSLRMEKGADKKRVHVKTLVVPDFDAISAVVTEAVRLAEQGLNVVWIRNTVRHAQKAYRALNSEKKGDDFEVGLLHSRFPAFQRGNYPKLSLEELKKDHFHEERWLWMLGKPVPPRGDARPKGCVLVATQVVEQSVDIDADVMITDLAPTDMLLQRLGRLHRHDRGERGQPTAYLVVPRAIEEGAKSISVAEIKGAFGSVAQVYAPYVLLRTWEQWQRREQIVLSADIREVLEATYVDRKGEPESWRMLLKDLESDRQRLRNLALRATDVRGGELAPDEEGLLTRFSRQRQMLLVLVRWVSDRKDKLGNPKEVQLLNRVKLKQENLRQFNRYAAQQLHLNAATIPAWWLPAVFREPLPPLLAQYFFEEVAIAVYLGDESERLVLGVKRHAGAPTICYHPDEGLWLEKPPDKKATRVQEDGESEDGMF